MDMIGLNRQLNYRPGVLHRYLTGDLLQARVRIGPTSTLRRRFGHQMRWYTTRWTVCVPFMCVVHADSIPFFNTARTAEGPFIPRLKPGLSGPILVRGGSMPSRHNGYAGA
jgi:hypothetical protein